MSTCVLAFFFCLVAVNAAPAVSSTKAFLEPKTNEALVSLMTDIGAEEDVDAVAGDAKVDAQDDEKDDAKDVQDDGEDDGEDDAKDDDKEDVQDDGEDYGKDDAEDESPALYEEGVEDDAKDDDKDDGDDDQPGPSNGTKCSKKGAVFPCRAGWVISPKAAHIVCDVKYGCNTEHCCDSVKSIARNKAMEAQMKASWNKAKAKRQRLRQQLRKVQRQGRRIKRQMVPPCRSASCRSARLAEEKAAAEDHAAAAGGGLSDMLAAPGLTHLAIRAEEDVNAAAEHATDDAKDDDTFAIFLPIFFADKENKDKETESQVKANKDMVALLQTQARPDDVAHEVVMESTQNFQIHDSFADEEKKDKETEGQVKANRDMTALLQTQTLAK